MNRYDERYEPRTSATGDTINWLTSVVIVAGGIWLGTVSGRALFLGTKGCPVVKPKVLEEEAACVPIGLPELISAPEIPDSPTPETEDITEE